MFPILQRRNTVITQPRGTSPHKYISMCDLNALRFVTALQTAKEESCGQSQRDGDNRLHKITLILVLMQRQSRTGFIPIDEARIRDEVREACFFGGSYCKLLKCRGHGGPGAIHLWV